MRFLLLLFSMSAQAAGWSYTSPDVHIVATYDKCEIPQLLARGFEFKIEIGVPLINLSKVGDYYKLDGLYVITTIGCWSEKQHKLYAYNKNEPDGYFDPNFHIDGTWVKQ